MKKYTYISLFVILGVLVSFLVHAAIEIPMIVLLVKDFEQYSLGLSWDAWVFIHNIGTGLLLILGIWFGYRQGVYWWQKIYTEKKSGILAWLGMRK